MILLIPTIRDPFIAGLALILAAGVLIFFALDALFGGEQQ